MISFPEFEMPNLWIYSKPDREAKKILDAIDPIAVNDLETHKTNYSNARYLYLEAVQKNVGWDDQVTIAAKNYRKRSKEYQDLGNHLLDRLKKMEKTPYIQIVLNYLYRKGEPFAHICESTEEEINSKQCRKTSTPSIA